MVKIKTYYVVKPNMGDQLNELILEQIFGYTPIRRTPVNCDLSGIGSGLGQFCYADALPLRILEFFSGKIWNSAYIWGTGFISYKKDRKFFRNKLHFCALRGNLSKRRVEKILGYSLGDIPLGDGGILASELLNVLPEKKYSVGIIPHKLEQNEPEFRILSNRFPGSVVIDLLDDPLEVVRQIASCQYVISSSLHGLIVADSFHIPNIHVKVTDRLLGDGFKFDDYYSGYNLMHEQFAESDIKDVSFISEHSRISPEMVEEKKRQMKDCFPFPPLKV